MTVYIIISAIIVVLIITTIIVYNRLVSNRNRMLEAWSGIDVYLKKRYDLIPSLVETVKGYATHERTTFENVTASRSAAMNANIPHDKIESEIKLDKAIAGLFVVAESYPELKANENFRKLQIQLADLEDEISASRRYYNGTVRENNIYIESFPSNVFASIFNFRKGEFYNIAETERGVPRMSF